MENINFDLYLIRHGESEANRKKNIICGRSPNAPLTRKGRLQAKSLGQRLAGEGIKFDKVFSSPFVRALDTCDLAVEPTGFRPDRVIIDDALVEMSQGEWEGRIREQVYIKDVLIDMNSQGKFFLPEGGESQRLIERRASNWFEDNILYNSEFYDGVHRTFAVFTHTQWVRAFLHYVMGFNDRLIHKIAIDNASLTRLYFDKSGWGIGPQFNDTSHLKIEEPK
ncbi:histidine phosphatase family protein [Candidatus Daviesbacteria bacterium]|nr:histidine phosphatase family protein [Candidatus Daviesbacteria bacterium]